MMISGTYQIKSYLGKTNTEINYFVFYEEKGELTGYINEIFYKLAPSFTGHVSEDGSFEVYTGVFASIMRDITVKLKGNFSNDEISGVLDLMGNEYKFKGKKVAEPMSFNELQAAIL
jgi:hypothetical protein